MSVPPTMPSLRSRRKPQNEDASEDDLGGQMSFLEHLDELRSRLIRSIVFVFLAASVSWFVSDRIYNFLARPVQKALTEAQQRRRVSIAGLNGQVSTLPLSSLKKDDHVRFVFPEATQLGPATIPAGTSVVARVDKDSQGSMGLFTDEPLAAGKEMGPKEG